MGWTIIYDPEQNIAALVDPDAPAALGPVTVGDPGDDPRRPLDEFVAGLDTPPEEMATWVLFNEWQAYVRAIVDLVEQAIEEDQETAGADGTAPEGITPPETVSEAPAPAGDATEASVGEPSPGPGEEDNDREAEELSERIAAAPHTPAKAGLEECWMCHGETEIDGPNGRTECPVCHGAGSTTPEEVQP